MLICHRKANFLSVVQDSSQIDLLKELMDLQKDMVVMLLSMLEGRPALSVDLETVQGLPDSHCGGFDHLFANLWDFTVYTIRDVTMIKD